MYEKSTRDTYQHEDQQLQQQQHLNYYSLELYVWNFQFLKQYILNPSKQDKDKKLNIADAPSLPCHCVSVCVVGFLTTNCLCLWYGRPRYWVFFFGGEGGGGGCVEVVFTPLCLSSCLYCGCINYQVMWLCLCCGRPHYASFASAYINA